MTEKKKKLDLPEAVIRKIEEAAEQRAGQNPATPEDQSETVNRDEPPAAIVADYDADRGTLEFCAELDHSDTDNGKRMQLHFGEDLLVIAQEKAKAPLYSVWTGTHWDVANGGPKSLAIAQRLGDRIAQEIEFIRPNPFEQLLMNKGEEAITVPEEARDPIQRRLAAAAMKAIEAHGKRVKRRLDHAVTSKNIAKDECSVGVPGASHHEISGRLQCQ